MNKPTRILHFIWLLWSCALGSLCSCTEEMPLPATLDIQEIELNIDPSTEGTARAQITEAWVFVDNVFLGAYDLPAQVPVLAEGPTDIRVAAGIRENGIRTTPRIYPFFTEHEETLTLLPGQTTAVRPQVGYRADARFGFIEDFEEEQSAVFTQVIDGDTTFARVQGGAFEGAFSGRLVLTEAQPIAELASRQVFSDLIQRSLDVFLEIHYRSDTPVVFGFVGLIDGIPTVFYDPGFNPSASWNKIYFNLGPLLLSSDLDTYSVSLRAFLIPDSMTPAEIYVDNIKLLYFGN